MKLTIRAMTQEERAYTYTQEDTVLEKSGCIGHLRGDMGADGDEFFTTWDDHGPELKTAAFKQEIGKVINLLRSNEQYGGLLQNRDVMKTYCKSNPDSAFQGSYTQEYAFRADTENYAYMIRCNPTKGDYNFYLYAYDRDMLDKALDPEKDKLKVLVVESGKRPYTKTIEPGLASLQHEVGGYIEAVYPFAEPVAIICDEEAKLKGSTLNRALRDEAGHIYDIIAGTFLITGLSEEDFASLEEEHMKQFSKHFETPEMFLRVNGKLMVLPMEEEKTEDERPSISEQIRGAKEKERTEIAEKDGNDKGEMER